MPGPFDKEGYLARRTYPQEQSREGNLELGQPRTFEFYEISGQHIILSLNFKPCATIAFQDIC